MLDQSWPTTSWQALPETRLSRDGKKESRWDVAFVVPFSTSGGRGRLATSFFQAKDDTPEKESGLTGCLRGHGARDENKSLEKSTDTGHSLFPPPIILKLCHVFLLPVARDVCANSSR